MASFSQADEAGQKLAEQTRQALQKAGFKIELSEFDVSAPPEWRTRETIYNNALWEPPAPAKPGPRRALRRADSLTYEGDPQSLLALNANRPNLMEIVNSNSASVVWEMPTPVKDLRPGPGYVPALTWDDYRRSFAAHGIGLDRAESAIFDGPISADLSVSGRRDKPRSYPPPPNALTGVRQALELRCLLALHDGDLPSAWTNLLAATRVVTTYEPLPPATAHLVAFELTAAAYEFTWQALQTNGWTEAQLAALQSLWESVDYFGRLPETVAYSRAQKERSFHYRRTQTFDVPFGDFMAWAFRFPELTWGMLNYSRNEQRYQQHESYVDEARMLEFTCHREKELQTAAHAADWPGMRKCLQATPQSSISGPVENEVLLARAAVAETRRRMIITALALERCRIRHRACPATLAGLAPEFLKSPPIDFMDGQPLPYQVFEDGHFTLYSVGLDGGKNQDKGHPSASAFTYTSSWLQPAEKAPILWPLPAPVATVESARAEVLKPRGPRRASR